MDKDTFLNKINELGTLEDIAILRTELVKLSDEVVKVYDDYEKNTSEIEKLNQTIEKNKSDMEDLRSCNMDLFKRIGSQKSEQKVKEESTGVKEPEEEKLTYEDLLKEGDDK